MIHPKVSLFTCFLRSNLKIVFFTSASSYHHQFLPLSTYIFFVIPHLFHALTTGIPMAGMAMARVMPYNASFFLSTILICRTRLPEKRETRNIFLRWSARSKSFYVSSAVNCQNRVFYFRVFKLIIPSPVHVFTRRHHHLFFCSTIHYSWSFSSPQKILNAAHALAFACMYLIQRRRFVHPSFACI